MHATYIMWLQFELWAAVVMGVCPQLEVVGLKGGGHFDGAATCVRVQILCALLLDLRKTMSHKTGDVDVVW